MAKRIGSRTIELTEDVRVAASAAVAGKKEGEGPLKDCFDYVSQDSYFAEDSWEKAETSMLRQCFGICRGKAGGAAFEPECVLGGICSTNASAPPLRSKTVPSPISGYTERAQRWRRRCASRRC